MKTAHPRCGFLPLQIEDPVAWVGHLPFAYWFTGVVRPQVFFELGTHSGNSYFTFCQAVREHGLQTRCNAVDLWTGDRHTGAYESTIYESVARRNRELYSEYSSLWRMSFDEAVSKVPDGSIDLLHIDGFHTYEAVRHDHETWKPKLAKGAWVLFHDTHVREGDFGVWRFWDELKAHYPQHLEFTHSHGLGVISTGVGKQEAWMVPNSPAQRQLVESFEIQGRSLLAWYEKSKKRKRKMVGDLWHRLFPGHPVGLGTFGLVSDARRN